MKKFILLFNNYLTNFWFTILLLIISGFLVIFFDPNMSVALSFGENGEFYSLSLILNRFLILFLGPLAIISIPLAVFIWLKDKTGDSYHGFSALIIILLTLGLSFLFILKLVALDYDSRQDVGIFKMPVIPVDEATKPNTIF